MTKNKKLFLIIIMLSVWGMVGYILYTSLPPYKPTCSEKVLKNSTPDVRETVLSLQACQSTTTEKK